MRKIYAHAAPLALTVLLGACGLQQEYDDERGRGDAPIEGRDDTPKEVINMPDQFSNVAHACDGHGHRVYVTTQTNGQKAMEVIPDETCN